MSRGWQVMVVVASLQITKITKNIHTAPKGTPGMVANAFPLRIENIQIQLNLAKSPASFEASDKMDSLGPGPKKTTGTLKKKFRK